jgi:hypothetical protein
MLYALHHAFSRITVTDTFLMGMGFFVCRFTPNDLRLTVKKVRVDEISKRKK